MRTVHVVVPFGIDDPTRPSGGNRYDRRVCRGLAAIGWSVREHAVPGTWPRPDAAACAVLTEAISGIADNTVVLLDGLIASAVPDVLVPEARRLRLVVLVHMPLGGDPASTHSTGPLVDQPSDDQRPDAGTREHAVLSAAAGVVTTSEWTRRWLLDRYALSPNLIHVAEPGADPADLAPGTTAGGDLLCVAAVAPHKGHDVLLAALAMVADLPWRCRCVGSLDRDPDFVHRIRRQAAATGIGSRLHLAGPQVGTELDIAYATADVLLLASRAETYGMVVTEALARGLPVIVTAVGGVPEAVGHGWGGERPGLLVPADDPGALAAALREWLLDGDLRCRLRQVAGQRRTTLSDWASTSLRISRVLTGVAA